MQIQFDIIFKEIFTIHILLLLLSIRAYYNVRLVIDSTFLHNYIKSCLCVLYYILL